MSWFSYIGGFALAVALFVAGGASDFSQAEGQPAEDAQSEQTEDIQAQPGDAVQAEGEVVEIPLERVIGLGLRRLRVLEPELFVYRDTPEKVKKYSTPEGLEELKEIRQRASEKSLVIPIEHALTKLPTGKEVKPAPGFAVKGSGRTALRGIYDVLAKNDKPTEEFPAGTDVSIIFFAHPTQPFVGLDRVEIDGGEIKIHYALISHGAQMVNWTLAVIPCGKLPIGTYQVEMIRSHERESASNPQGFSPADLDIEQRIVCQPFSFRVVEQYTD